jgi:hypothetical protein
MQNSTNPREMTASENAELGGEASPDPDDGVGTVAGYIADMAGQLEAMARSAELELLSYLLAMARAEADTITRLPERGGRWR